MTKGEHDVREQMKTEKKEEEGKGHVAMESHLDQAVPRTDPVRRGKSAVNPIAHRSSP